MILQGCEVKWNIYIPIQQENTPCILLTSHGTHLHAPPPPKKTPRALIKGILNVLRKVDDPTLTPGKKPVLFYFYMVFKMFLKVTFIF